VRARVWAQQAGQERIFLAHGFVGDDGDLTVAWCGDEGDDRVHEHTMKWRGQAWHGRSKRSPALGHCLNVGLRRDVGVGTLSVGIVSTTCEFKTPMTPPDPTKVYVYVNKVNGSPSPLQIIFGCKDFIPPGIIP
jgi:hypothetical protein